MGVSLKRRDDMTLSLRPCSPHGVVLLLVLVFIPAIVPAYATEGEVFFREDFNDLTGWRPFFFPKIENHTSYQIESDGIDRYVKAESHASASALIYQTEFDVYQYPQVR
jgi:hypothetical protein